MPYIRDSTALLADGKIHKLADAWHFLDLPDCGSDCGDNQARPTVIDSRSILAGVQGFESLSPHILFLNEYPAACCGWDGQETDLRKGAYSMLDD